MKFEECVIGIEVSGNGESTVIRVKDVQEENILQEAHRLTSAAGARPDDYGHPRENLGLTAALWSPILGVEVTAEQVSLCMIQLKIARQLHKSGRDNLVDIAGWARTIERLSEQ